MGKQLENMQSVAVIVEVFRLDRCSMPPLKMPPVVMRKH
jgi:hypothetical protein